MTKRQTSMAWMASMMLVLLTAVSCQANSKEESSVRLPEMESKKNQVVVYYFHATKRCNTCRTIERYTREALEEKFKPALESGALVMRSLSVDQSENRHFIQDYGLVSSSVVVSNVVDGKEKEWKRLDDVWKHVSVRLSFLEYIQKGVEPFLKTPT